MPDAPSKTLHWHLTLQEWLQRQDWDGEPASTIAGIGDFTARRRERGGRLVTDHLERGLLIYQIIQTRNIGRALQVGVEFGFNCAVMVQAALDGGRALTVDAVDYLASDHKRAWPLNKDGADIVEELSLSQVLHEHFPATAEVVHHHSGPETRQLFSLLRSGARYGLIVISGGATPYELVRYLCYCIPMLEDDGAILLDRFSPANASGLGTVMLLPHLRRLFIDVSRFESEGTVWPIPALAVDRQSMLLASGHRFPEWRLHRTYLPYWKLVSWLMGRVYRDVATFPLKPDID